VHRAPGIPCAFLFIGGGRLKARTHHASRECGCTSSSVMPRVRLRQGFDGLAAFRPPKLWRRRQARHPVRPRLIGSCTGVSGILGRPVPSTPGLRRASGLRPPKLQRRWQAGRRHRKDWLFEILNLKWAAALTRGSCGSAPAPPPAAARAARHHPSRAAPAP